MGSCNSGIKGNISDLWLGIGKRGTPKSVEYAMNNANPNYFDTNAEAEGWHNNCQSCALTLEAMMRGYDTEAVPHKKGDPFYLANGEQHYLRDCFKGKQSTQRVGEDKVNEALAQGDIAKAERLAKNVGIIRVIEGHTVAVNTKTDIVSQMKTWGDGSRATLSVKWKSGGGHVINIINKGSEVFAIDAQQHRIRELGEMLSRAKINHTALTRVDNLKFTRNVRYLTKGKKQ